MRKVIVHATTAKIMITIIYTHLWHECLAMQLDFISDFIPGSLEDTDKYIEVADGHHVTAKQKGQVRIQMCDDNGITFIATLYNVLLAPDLCDRLFSIITLMNAGHTCLFHKVFCTVYLCSYTLNLRMDITSQQNKKVKYK